MVRARRNSRRAPDSTRAAMFIDGERGMGVLAIGRACAHGIGDSVRHARILAHSSLRRTGTRRARRRALDLDAAGIAARIDLDNTLRDRDRVPNRTDSSQDHIFTPLDEG